MSMELDVNSEDDLTQLEYELPHVFLVQHVGTLILMQHCKS